MLKRKFSRLSEIGSLMVEAMAMLALISMVTPILYKKAAERTTELQDINAASQMRSLVKSVDDYVKDNYDKIIAGDKVTNSAGNEQNYSVLGSGSGKVTVPMAHFRDYLPYGFLDNNGAVQETKTFGKDYKVVLKKVDATVGGTGGATKKTITAFIVAPPKEGDSFPMLRASRIASMIGSNGGYAEKKGGKVVANGVQGIWSISDMNAELGVTATNGAIVASSVQPIIAAGGGGDSENYLYRKYHATKPELNEMQTDLYMGGIKSPSKNILNVNQMIITADNAGKFVQGTDDTKALYVKGGGAYIKGALSAMADVFKVDATGMKYGTLFSVDTTNLKYGTDGSVIKASASDLNLLNGKIVVNSSGTKIDSKTNIAGDTVIGDLTGAVNKTDGTANKLTVKGNADVTGIFTAGEIRTEKFKSQELYAGMDSTYKEADANLHVTKALATLKQADFTVATDKLVIKPTASSMKNETITLTGTGTDGTKVSKLLLNANAALSSTGTTAVSATGAATLYSTGSGVGIYTGSTVPTAVANEVSVQDNMFRVNNFTSLIDSVVKGFTIKDKAVPTKIVEHDIEGAVSRVRSMNFQVENPNRASVFTVNPKEANKESVVADVQTFNVKSEGIVIDPTDANSNRDVVVKNGTTTATNTTGYTYIGKGRLDVRDAGTKVLVVDAKGTDKAVTTGRGSVYIRKGVVELESPYTSTITDAVAKAGASDANDKGYVRADRFVSNREFTAPISSGVPAKFNRGVIYDAYQVNPAYTSVMHDIKLTTRGGARLSDILPDFINKGIYVVDNTYKESVGSWEEPKDCPSFTSGKSCQTIKSNANVASNHTDWTSPWLGVVPAPVCPPGYAKVITITPAGFAMAQAGIPGPDTKKKRDIVIVNYPRDPNADYTANPSGRPTPLYFQKSTWLRAKVYTHGSDDSFKGWSAIMGFMYPYTYYSQYMKDIGVVGGSPSSDTIAWNLFPVFRKQLEAYATVYCYFDRKGNLGTKFNKDIVDIDYDQLSNFRAPMSGKAVGTVGSDSDYINRLNDPNLKYTEPW